MTKTPAARGQMTELKYGNTNTFLIGSLLIDTDYAGKMRAFCKALKAGGRKLSEVKFVLATHYHPDHMGLIGELAEHGVQPLLLDVQSAYVHASDHIFARELIPFVPVDESRSTVISFSESRAFLAELGISGEIIHTPSHSPDSVSVVMDNGNCYVGDLEPFEYIEAYGDDSQLKADWDRILSFKPRRIFSSHRPEIIVG